MILRRRPCGWIWIALVASSLGASREAHAQVSTNAAAAQALFDEAKALAKKGDYAAACPKFADSQRLDPGGGTILHAADCHERWGKLATAWGMYNEALSLALRDKRADREAVARERIAELSPRIARLTVTAPEDLAKDDSLVVEVDGTPLDRAAWNAGLPIDRGVHTVRATARGRTQFSRDVMVADGDKPSVAIEMSAEARLTAETAKRAVVDEAPASNGRRTLGLAVGGIGVVGIGVGAVFGIRAITIGDQSGSCTLGPTGPGSGSGCPQSAVDEQDSARTSGTISTIAFAMGGAALAAGAFLVLTSATSKKAAAALRPALDPRGGVALSLGGAF